MTDDPANPPAATSSCASDHSGPAVVAIGASAGGLRALRRLFAELPRDSGVAFVVVVHLSPERESQLAEILQPHVAIPVQQVTEETPLEPNRIYIIPPGRNLSAVDSHLRLSELEDSRQERAPVDHFFRTLAGTHDGDAIGIILTGSGSDGALGVRAIKEHGGLTIVQDPEEAEYDGMPRSAMATGTVDLVLPLERILPAVFRFLETEPRVQLEGASYAAEQPRMLDRIFAQLRAQTERDFSGYKRSTILRRVARRMQLHHVERLEDYLDRLREDAEEVVALADDLLINVTSFFRDAALFDVLERDVVPRLFVSKRPEDVVRVWSVGCATGEEAYSLAILLLEHAQTLDAPPRLQLFASDLHEPSLARAREGFYPGDISADVSHERLQRFFVRADDGYRIRKDIRELVVFTPHNVLSDPPFSKLDLVSCRNLLIYLERDVQRDVVALFHYALLRDGALVLGGSESLGDSELFRTDDKKLGLYTKRNVPNPEPRLPVFPALRLRHPPRGESPAAEPPAYGTLHERVVEQYGPPSLLLGPEDKVVHLSAQAGRYLVHPGGQLTSSVYKLLREELRIELRTTLHAARDRGEPQRSKPVSLTLEGEPRSVALDVRPALGPEYGDFVLLMFDERPHAAQPPPTAPESPSSTEDGFAQARLAELEAELDLTRERLQAVIEEYETSQEEMKASNEELQSANEELRSTLEELETGKEELQSVNEELHTVNQENHHKVEELAQLSSDLQNLLASTDIATLFLDRELRIMRFTPKVSELFNVLHTDRGRPISDLTRRLGYAELVDDATEVLRRLVPVEREMQDEAGRWYLTRVLPYRSGEDRIGGVVITSVDITARRLSEDALRRSEQRYRSLVEQSIVGVLNADEEGTITFANPALGRMLGYRPEALLGMNVMALTHPDHRTGSRSLMARMRSEGDPIQTEKRLLRADGTALWVDVHAALLSAQEAALSSLVLIVADIHERKEAEHALKETRDLLAMAVAASNIGFGTWDFEAGTTEWDERGQAIFELPSGGGTPEDWLERIHPEDRPRVAAHVEECVARGEDFDLEYRIVLPSGETRCIHGTGTFKVGPDGTPLRGTGLVRDVTVQRTTEAALKALNETLEEQVRERTREVREFASKLSIAEQEERRRLAQLLHDDLQQLLYGVEVKMGMIHDDLEQAKQPQLSADVDRVRRWVADAVTKTRQLTADLVPPVLAQPDFRLALEWLKRHMKQLHEISCELEAPEKVTIDDEHLRALLFQFIRELLFNVKKHAGTDRATIRLETRDHHVVVEIVDGGRGFDPREVATRQARGEGYGLVNMRKRLLLLGGQLDVRASTGNGTKVALRAPLESNPEVQS